MTQSRAIVITGANRGIGNAICQIIAEQGPPGTVYAASRAGVDLAFRSTKAVHFRYPRLDITDAASIEDLAQMIKDEQGGVDVLFNNAGVNIVESQTGPKAFADNKQIMDVNFNGTLRMCKAFLPLMKPGGRIVNLSMTISDLQGLAAEYEACAKAGTARENGWPDSGYRVSKACINAMTAILARESGDLLINACCPGWVDTEMGEQIASQPPKSTIEGARIPVRLGFEDIGNVSGRYWPTHQLQTPALAKCRIGR